MRYLAIDPGGKRTGLAIGDSVGSVVSPLEVVESPGGTHLVEIVVKAAKREQAESLVIGLPKHMDGRESPGCVTARQLGAVLAQATGLAVYFQDERLTSAEADHRMAQSGLTHGQKKKRRDAIAAAVLLSDFLESGPREADIAASQSTR